jgi:hypothetical protein
MSSPVMDLPKGYRTPPPSSESLPTTQTSTPLSASSASVRSAFRCVVAQKTFGKLKFSPAAATGSSETPVGCNKNPDLLPRIVLVPSPVWKDGCCSPPPSTNCHDAPQRSLPHSPDKDRSRTPLRIALELLPPQTLSDGKRSHSCY